MMLDNTTLTLKYDALEDLLTAARSNASAAEVHGFASGWIASGSRWDSAQRSFVESFDLTRSPELREAMVRLAELIENSLGDEDFGFQLLLPDEDQDINRRRVGLSDWCRGFLTGFGLTGRFQQAELSDEVQELLKDLTQISQVEDEMADDDENESDLTEITEYVRMGAIMTFTDCATKAVH